MEVYLGNTSILSYFEGNCKTLFQAKEPIYGYAQNLSQFPQLVVSYETGADLDTGDAGDAEVVIFHLKASGFLSHVPI
jgi:hypothetical protein